jgi:hypothetical protein
MENEPWMFELWFCSYNYKTQDVYRVIMEDAVVEACSTRDKEGKIWKLRIFKSLT